MTVRETTQEIERRTLSPYAALSANSRGRAVFEEPCPLRTDYQRDRDRIIHSKAFRRLRQKTQVFLSPVGDHYRTRITHTLEVSQIARTIARALRLNEDLTEAISLGHDVGHTAFGHAGERALQEVCPFPFHHNEQSVRVVEKYEKDGKGLNLTAEVKDGILCHTKSRGQVPLTLEGKIVQYSDRIAYMNHDIEDAIRAGILRNEDIPKEITGVLGDTKSERITSLVISLVENSGADIAMGQEQQKAYDLLHKFMFGTVYVNPVAKGEENKAGQIIRDLYNRLLSQMEKLPEEYKITLREEGPERAVCDYVAGMTDAYVMSAYSDIFIPKAWSKL